MKLRKAFIISGLVVLFSLASQPVVASTTQPPVYVDGIIAVVDGQVITVSMILRQTAELEVELAQRLPRDEFNRRVHELRSEALETLINNKLLIAEYKSRKYEIPEPFVNQRINDMIIRETGGDRGRFEAMLQTEGMSMDDFREQFREHLIVELMLDEEVRPFGNVTESEIREFYRENQEEFLMPERILAQRIFISRNTRSQEAFQEVVEKVMMRLRRGDDFELLGLEVSDDQEALALRWLEVKELDPRTAVMAQRLPLKEVSPPIVTDEGVYFLRIEEKTGETVEQFSVVREVIEDVLTRRRQKERYDRLMTRLRQRFQVRVYQ